jgi:hypothetical protein
MNSGQTLLVIGAFVVLSTLTLNVNASLVLTSSTGLEMEATLDAISIAQTLLDEILTKEFDRATTDGKRIYGPSELTIPSDLGTDGAGEKIVGLAGIDTSSRAVFESQSKFDDVDDYVGYKRQVWNPQLGWFEASVSVSYVDEDDPDVEVSSRTFCKRITIQVSHPNLVKDLDYNMIPLTVRDLAIYRRYF